MFDVWLNNNTPFDAATHVQVDKDGQEILVVLVSATFAAQDDGSLTLAECQVPVCFGDEFWGDPRHSSVRWEADIAPRKPLVDVVVNGEAKAPGGRPTTEVKVGILLAGIRKVLRVVGDRIRMGNRYSRPKPFVSMPIVYERAFGGCTSEGEVFFENPIGIGYHGATSMDPQVLTDAPNVEYALKRIRRPGDIGVPAGFGVVGRSWSQRLRFAGTYDQNWVDNVWPLPPSDFDARYNQSAPSDQQTSRIQGGESVELLNLTSHGCWRFRLPHLNCPLWFIYDDRIEEERLRIDTVMIDAECQSVTVKCRFAIRSVRNVPKLREVVLGRMPRGRLIALRKGKRYFGRSVKSRPDGVNRPYSL